MRSAPSDEAAAAGKGCFYQKKIVPLPSGPAPAQVTTTELEEEDGPKWRPNNGIDRQMAFEVMELW